MAHDVFISYASEDKPVADAVCATLEARGIRCWIAPRDIMPGLDRGEAVIDAIRNSRVMVLIFSSNANMSYAVKRDVERAVNRGIALVPFRIENVPMSKSLEYFMSVPHWLDALTPPLENHLSILAENVAILLTGDEYRHPLRSGTKGTAGKQLRKAARWIVLAALFFAIVIGSAGFFIYRAIFPSLRYSRFQYTVATLDANGSIKGRVDREGNSYTEDFGNGIELEMVEIPGNNFWMGSSAADAVQAAAEYRKIGISARDATGYTSSETPQGPVKVVAFYLSRGEITQEQWSRVAGWPEINRPLSRSPSFFSGLKRPVEQVSWEEANEFCDRLSVHTGRPYRLPSEGEWEFACRAGTTAPFHFGESLNAQTANFNAAFPWGSAPRGNPLRQTTEIGSTNYSNGFGLFDMHGNVQEWCADPWHPDYRNSPSGAGVWEAGGDPRFRVVRGGSYLSAAAFCRCSARSREKRESRSSNTGFRVAIFANDLK